MADRLSVIGLKRPSHDVINKYCDVVHIALFRGILLHRYMSNTWPSTLFYGPRLTMENQLKKRKKKFFQNRKVNFRKETSGSQTPKINSLFDFCFII